MTGADAPVQGQRWPEAMVRRTQFEVIPLPGIVPEVIAHLQTDLRVSITSSPKQGIDATVAVARELSEHGYIAIPHLAARQIRDEAQLHRILDDLAGSEVQELFVIAGDIPHPAGQFEGSLDLLSAVHRSDHSFTLGVGGYPEGHPFAPGGDDAIRQLQEKAAYASYIVTQLCFDAGVLLDWVRRIRAQGVHVPVRAGVAGPVDIGRLLRIGARVGVGPSLRMLTSKSGGIRRLLAHGTWNPDDLLAELAPAYQEREYGLEGLHVYTFNALEAVASWWRTD